MLAVTDISVSFGGVAVLDRVSLEISRGEVLALLGPSGAGKTTLLRVIAGLLAPDNGRIQLDGRDITSLPAYLRNIGLVFQDDQLFPHLSVADNIAFGLRIKHQPRPAIEQRVAELLHLVGLEGFGGRDIARLSGGEGKRVALARALAPRPTVLLLDEPLAGLDRELHDRLVIDLSTVLRTAGTTALLVTHNADEAAAVADRTVTLPDLTNRRLPS